MINYLKLFHCFHKIKQACQFETNNLIVFEAFKPFKIYFPLLRFFEVFIFLILFCFLALRLHNEIIIWNKGKPPQTGVIIEGKAASCLQLTISFSGQKSVSRVNWSLFVSFDFVIWITVITNCRLMKIRRRT